MRKDPGHDRPRQAGAHAAADAQRRAEITCLGLAIAWMLVAQLGAVLLWEAGMLTRPGALLHWLVVGVLPPALALWHGAPRDAG